jgi:hypothetical protein
VVRLITEKNLENGLILTIVDHSRPVAADRWYVKIVANLRLRAEGYPCPLSDDPELDRLTRERIGDCLEHQLVRERNFIDAVVKDEIVEQVTAELQNIVSRYLEEKSFPARLFTIKYREIRDLCVVERGRKNQVQEEENEPVDFSHCFK